MAVATGGRPGLLSTRWPHWGPCSPHQSPRGCTLGAPTRLARLPPPTHTHHQDNAPEVGGPQHHIQVMRHLRRGIGGKAEALSQAPTPQTDPDLPCPPPARASELLPGSSSPRQSRRRTRRRPHTPSALPPAAGAPPPGWAGSSWPQSGDRRPPGVGGSGSGPGRLV